MSVGSVRTTPYEEHKDYVLNVLGRRCGWLERADREALYHDAYAVMLEKERDGELLTATMRPAQVRAYLTQTALYKALDESRRAERRRTAPLEDNALNAPDPAPAVEERLATKLDDARVREIVDELPARMQAIVKLRFFFDRTPGEIQRALGITERSYRRDLERGLKHIAERYELVREGSFCESRRSLILAYIAGIAGPNREIEARRHLETCPACMHWALEMRAATRAVAMLPLPVAAFADHGRLAAVVGAVKQVAASLLARADPGVTQYAPALRPGAAGAAVAGCLALGGGATYCVVEGLPEPVRGAIAAREKPERAQRASRQAPARPARVVVKTPTPTLERSRSTERATAPQRKPKPKSKPTARRSQAPRPTAPPPSPEEIAGEQEFGLEPSAPQERGRTATVPPAPSKPPLNKPPSEFDP